MPLPIASSTSPAHAPRFGRRCPSSAATSPTTATCSSGPPAVSPPAARNGRIAGVRVPHRQRVHRHHRHGLRLPRRLHGRVGQGGLPRHAPGPDPQVPDRRHRRAVDRDPAGVGRGSARPGPRGRGDPRHTGDRPARARRRGARRPAHTDRRHSRARQRDARAGAVRPPRVLRRVGRRRAGRGRVRLRPRADPTQRSVTRSMPRASRPASVETRSSISLRSPCPPSTEPTPSSGRCTGASSPIGGPDRRRSSRT